MAVLTRSYATVVADPPWHYDRTGVTFKDADSGEFTNTGLPYQSMSLDEIASLPVDTLAMPAAHLYLWVTNRYLWDAPVIARAWGFRPSKIITWCKPPAGICLGDSWGSASEFVLFAHRGGLRPLSRVPRDWFEWPRGPHSAKPEAFLDLVEQISPGPYVEMFARRARFGWDYWGDESLGTAVLDKARYVAEAGKGRCSDG